MVSRTIPMLAGLARNFTTPTRAAPSFLLRSGRKAFRPLVIGVTAMNRSFVGAAVLNLHTSAQLRGITPDNKPVSPKPEDEKVITPANITDAEFHKEADDYLDRLLAHLERLQDTREDVDVEYSAGVLTVSFGDDTGTYVINKQPPNKQIWVSSPKSGPKRFDFVVLGDGQHEKQDTAASDWMYLRDKSTMNQLFLEELGIDIRMSVGHYGD